MKDNREMQYKETLESFLNHEELTSQDIERIMDEQLDLPAEEMDASLIHECLLYLYPEYEKGEMSGAKESKAKILKAVREVSRERASRKNVAGQRRRSGRLRPVMVYLLVLMGIMLLGTAIAYALGYPVWNYVFHWEDEQVRIEIDVQSPVNTSDPIRPQQYHGVGKGDAFDEKIKELQFDLALPQLPDQYILSNVDSDASGTFSNLLGLYMAGEMEQLHIAIQKVDNAEAMVSKAIEKDGNYEVYTISGTSCYLFTNIDYVEAIWVSPPYFVQIGGNLDRQELVDLLNTMDGGTIK